MAKKKMTFTAELRLPDGRKKTVECNSKEEAQKMIQFWITEMRKAGIEMIETKMHKGKAVTLH